MLVSATNLRFSDTMRLGGRSAHDVLPMQYNSYPKGVGHFSHSFAKFASHVWRWSL
jgi:hypothetical protein